jgi:hypothetical protein
MDFVGNERIFALMHDSDSAMLDAELEFQASMAPAERNLAIAEARLRAVGGTPRTTTSDRISTANRVAKAREQLENTDVKYKAEGDRITTLLIANKCAPPDHVTTWFTYSRKNPNAPK